MRAEQSRERSGRHRPRLLFFICSSVPTDIKVHETGVISSTRLRVMAVLWRGDENTRGTVEQSGRGGWAAGGGP